MTPAEHMTVFLADQTAAESASICWRRLPTRATPACPPLRCSAGSSPAPQKSSPARASSGFLPSAAGAGTTPPNPRSPCGWNGSPSVGPAPKGRAPGPGSNPLAFAAHLPLSRADLGLLSPIKDHLRDHPDAEPVPIPERSYALYGDEKRLARISIHRLVTAGLLSITDHLRAYPSLAPLAMYELAPAPIGC
ncbi:hypothetical protein ACWCV9_33545 [Streptomyces sp. NPDC001606]